MTNKQDSQEKIRQHLDLLREKMFKIEVEVLEGGKLPAKAHKTDAGFDLYATEDVVIYPGHVIKHPLNIRMKLPEGCWARIETKSGLGSKGMLVYAGVVDQNYRGIPHVIATNLKIVNGPRYEKDGQEFMNVNLDPIIVKKGEKLAQMTMNPHNNEYYVVEVEKVDTDTDRGEGGFGSTGSK
jgi:dUTP pyrophosphatase